MPYSYRRRRVSGVIISLVILTILLLGGALQAPQGQNVAPTSDLRPAPAATTVPSDALETLKLLSVKGRAPKTDYSREQFGSGWAIINGCDMRNIILNRDLVAVEIDDTCKVIKGTLNDPYTGQIIQFVRGADTSADVQIDHVIALSDAWQKGAQQLSSQQRAELANDPLELLAVDGAANQQKSDGDAATWLPPNKAFRCQYVARQIAVKHKYSLWVTPAEFDAMSDVLQACPAQTLPKA
jgi:hypothetical protein